MCEKKKKKVRATKQQEKVGHRNVLPFVESCFVFLKKTKCKISRALKKKVIKESVWGKARKHNSFR